MPGKSVRGTDLSAERPEHRRRAGPGHLRNSWNFPSFSGIVTGERRPVLRARDPCFQMTSVESASAGPDAWFELNQDGRTLAVGGAWTIAESARLDQELNALEIKGGEIAIDASKLSRLDSAGAWLLLRTRRALEAKGATISDFRLPEMYRPLLGTLERPRKSEPRKSRIPQGFRGWLYRMGRTTVHIYTQTVEMLAYLGRVTVESGEAIVRPRGNLRVAALFRQIEETGICLLYTSPSPRDGLLSRMPSSA